MTDSTGTDESFDNADDGLDKVDLQGLDHEETAFDRTRTDYTGAVLDEDFQPVDDVELAEEGMLLDDPDRIGLDSDDEVVPSPSLDPEDVGWELDEKG